MIKLESVSKSYGSIKVLETFSFGVETSKSVCLVGRSGCGKSTLLKIVALIAKPDSGNVIIDGIDVNGLKDPELQTLRRKKISYSFQEPLLMPYLTAVENLTEVIGVSRETAVEVLSKLGLSHRLRHKPSKLSVGEKKRVDIARALLRGSPILVADEPLSNLDPANGVEVMNLLKAYARKGGTVVYSTVEPSDAKFADNTITM
jgi:ABC-type lipoprotein export system ATPase subunit